MSHTSGQLGTSDLTPELAAKLSQVERDVARIETEAARRIRWRWLSVIPHLAQIFALLGFLGYAVMAIGFLVGRPWARNVDPTDQAIRALSGLVGCGLSLLIATWASRYCDAKADGKL